VREYRFRVDNKFQRIVAELVFNCPLLPASQNNLAKKRPMGQKSLATPLLSTDIKAISNPSQKLKHQSLSICSCFTYFTMVSRVRIRITTLSFFIFVLSLVVYAFFSFFLSSTPFLFFFYFSFYYIV
jgi:hypothetical protein